MIVNVYVPTSGDHWSIAPGSAICGTPQQDLPGGERRIKLDYEGNRYNQFKDWDEMLFHAAGRHAEDYPTVARSYLFATDVVQVGTYDTATKQLTVTDPDRLDAWKARLGESR